MLPSDIHPEQEESRAARNRALVQELIDMGVDLARMLHAKAIAAAQAPAPPEPSSAPEPDHTVAFDRIVRTVRRTVLLAEKLAEPPPAPKPILTPARIVARKRILRTLEQVIDEHADTAEHADTLRAELHERLERPDFDDDIDHRDIFDIIGDLRHDLGLGKPFGAGRTHRRTPADIATLQARAQRLPLPPARENLQASPNPPPLPRGEGRGEGLQASPTPPESSADAPHASPNPRELAPPILKPPDRPQSAAPPPERIGQLLALHRG